MNKTVLITGGANGIGRASAAAFLAAGCRVAITDIDGAAAESVARAHGDHAVGLAADVTDRGSLAAAFASAEDALGPIDVVHANAGVSVDWFGPTLALFSLILIDVWQWTPFMLLMFLAGLESLPRAPFEAARIDGAGAWLTFRALTLPLLMPVLVIAVIIRALDAFKVFEYVFAITRGGPGDATETLMYFIYQTGFRFFRMGEAAAAAIVVICLTMALVVALVWAARDGAKDR